MKIEFYKHNVGSRDIANLNKVLRSIFLTTGSVTEQLEKDFSKYLKTKYAVGATSATAALHLSLLALGIGRGDEVITTPMSFVATANAILHVGAKPVFVDVEAETGNIDAEKIESAITRKTKAIMPVHLYGQLCDMRAIKKIANKHRLKIIEDAAHCIEGERDGIKPGQLGDVACFSFYATKNITSGEGGMITTNNKRIADGLKKLRLHGMDKSAADRYTKKYQHYDVSEIGWKYNMFDIQAALLINQLENIDKLLKKRELIYKKYIRGISKIPGLDWPKLLPNSKSAYHLFTIWVDLRKRDSIMWKLQNAGIGVAVNFRSIHLFKAYRNMFGFKKGDFPEAERIGSSTISLPFYPKIKQKELAYVIARLSGIMKKI